jgi:two-component sensor histidine kinase
MSSGSVGNHGVRVPQPDAWLYLEEITHRALNDYTAMLAMVRRAAEMAPDPTSGQILTEVGTRLRSAAMRYQALRPPLDGEFRDLNQELASLCTWISNSVLSSRGITLSLLSDTVTISAFRCWQISLVISELITNAARHAFRRHETGAVIVTVIARDDILKCAIVDDGSAEGLAFPGRGTAIVDALIGDLGGTISREYSSTGSTIAFFVPLADGFFRPVLVGRNETPPGGSSFVSGDQVAER